MGAAVLLVPPTRNPGGAKPAFYFFARNLAQVGDRPVVVHPSPSFRGVARCSRERSGYSSHRPNRRGVDDSPGPEGAPRAYRIGAHIVAIHSRGRAIAPRGCAITCGACIWWQQRIPGRQFLTELTRARLLVPATVCSMPQASAVQRRLTRNRRAAALLGRSDLASVRERAAGGQQAQATESPILVSPSSARQYSTVVLGVSRPRESRRRAWT